MPRINDLKTCIVCGKPQAPSNFGLHNKTSDGLRKVCRHCAAKRRAQVKAARTRGTLVRPQKFAKPEATKVNPPPLLTQERVEYIKGLIDDAEQLYRALIPIIVEDKYKPPAGLRLVVTFNKPGGDDYIAKVSLPPVTIIGMLMRRYNATMHVLGTVGVDMKDWVKNHPPVDFGQYANWLLHNHAEPDPSSPDTDNDED